jgi:hypothetical protein
LTPPHVTHADLKPRAVSAHIILIFRLLPGHPRYKLVGGFNHLEKYSMGRIVPYIMENKQCLKPSTRFSCMAKYEASKV